MSIKIYTYTNPYAIEEECFWDEIRKCPQFCVSQTLVNGMKKTYPYFQETLNITTIRNLVNHLYKQWDEIGTKVKQMVEVDNAIAKLKLDTECNESIRNSLYNNTKSIASCLRIFSELGLNPFNFKTENINIDQKYLVDIYEIVFSNPNSSFKFERVYNESKINEAIKKSLFDAAGAKKQDKIPFEKIEFNKIVISGVHQFSPAMLCAIEDISKIKDVILIFNYQKQYQKVYKTWIDVYNCFNTSIKISDNDEYVANVLIGESCDANILADCIGKMADCEYSERNDVIDNVEIVEFENNIEFANYVARFYEKAKKACANDNNPYSSPLKYMGEQFYAASTKVNDILRAYFPEQFEQRHFLDYPIGHFFIATMNMWDSENNEIVVNNFSDIKECLTSGILAESKQGILISTFNKIEPYIDELKNYNQILSKLRELKKNLSSVFEEKKRVGYFNVSNTDLLELINRLEDLKGIINSFFVDFKNGGKNFKHFYDKIKQFIVSKVEDNSEHDKEIIGVMKEMIVRMEQTDIPSSGSFITLKQTLTYYLSQNENVNHGAKWIVRGFEQIDGDILNSDSPSDHAVYHFCCVSDKDICANKDERLPWPLDVNFFKYIQIPLDWKYQLYVKSKSEYHNFNLYALLYGLEFCRNKCKISYVKCESEKENELYHMISMLGLKPKKYCMHDISGYLPHLIYSKNIDVDIKDYVDSLDRLSRIKFYICPYKFGLEEIAQNHTIFRDRFLIHMYMRVLMKNHVLENLQGKSFNETMVRKEISEYFQKIDNKFRICTKLEKAQLLAQVYKDVVYPYNMKDYIFKMRHVEVSKKAMRDEHLLDYTVEKNLETLNSEQIIELLRFNGLPYKNSGFCKYCASKDVCLECKNY